MRLQQRHGKALERRVFRRARASISLHYGDTLEVRLAPAGLAIGRRWLPSRKSTSIPPGCCGGSISASSSTCLEDLRKLDDQAVVYSDVLEYIDRENELAEGLEIERRLLASSRRAEDPLEGRPEDQTPALPGAAAPSSRPAAGASSSPTTWAWERPSRRWRRPNCCAAGEASRRVLVIAPASVKYQWKTEIEKFTDPAPRRSSTACCPNARNSTPPRPSSI